MPKYFCDYCDTFLTHDTPSVRKTHNSGRKHRENVRMYYQQWLEEQAQKLVDATARAFRESNVMRNPVGMMPPPGAMLIPGASSDHFELRLVGVAFLSKFFFQCL
ncbi:zf-U1 domain containing protein [Trichuris trichiura]|uniref:Zf-U1 domain containing protein n=1 Tax=Trichuris trichiura TaxID=36087 RepID=A0A077Z4Z1_TRITR|nr:zf-U1 domain containing protein [Trichuris trichiura]